MDVLQADGLLDWSRVPSSALAETYVQLIVTSGLGCDAMLHEGEENDWLSALHRDVLCDCSARGSRHFFNSKVDTIIVGVLGRKRIVLLPPGQASGKWWCGGMAILGAAPPRSSLNWRSSRDLLAGRSWRNWQWKLVDTSSPYVPGPSVSSLLAGGTLSGHWTT